MPLLLASRPQITVNEFATRESNGRCVTQRSYYCAIVLYYLFNQTLLRYMSIQQCECFLGAYTVYVYVRISTQKKQVSIYVVRTKLIVYGSYSSHFWIVFFSLKFSFCLVMNYLIHQNIRMELIVEGNFRIVTIVSFFLNIHECNGIVVKFFHLKIIK